MAVLENALLGIIFGGLYALSASGIVVTYTATGVFNIAHFAIALFASYVAWQLSGVWGLPLLVVVPITLLLCGPLLGIVLERVVFRPLQARRAASSEKLVAALGVTVVFLALINVIWGPGVQGTTDEPVPRIFGVTGFDLGSLRFDSEQIGSVLTILAVCGLLYVLLRRTFLGTCIRAVVDRRELAELSAIDANRVSQVAWGLGCTLAALTGLLITRGVLEPNKIIFLGIETFSVAVVARLVSLPVAVLFGFFVMGMGRALLDGFQPFGTNPDAWQVETYDAVVLNLSSIVLFAALVLFRRLDEVGDTGTTGQGLVMGALGRARRIGPVGITVGCVLGAASLLAPAVLHGADIHLAHQFLALAVIFLSITCITGFSGHVTLGQASIAGLGAFASARFTNAFDLPVLVGMIPGALVALVAGLVAGYPALRRKGLFLGLTTLALALIIDRFVFNARLFAGGPGGLEVRRPSLFGLDLSGDVAFYFYELVVVGAMLYLANNLRSGRLGRALSAMRDSETAARSVGIDLRRAKLFVFAVSAGMAGVGGAMFTQADANWDVHSFNPVFGLFWFVAVVVCGVSEIRGAILAAVLYISIPRLTGQDVQSAIGLFGLAALALGRLPGGIVGQLERLPSVLTRHLTKLYRDETAPPPEPAPVPQPSAFAQRILEERAAANR